MTSPLFAHAGHWVVDLLYVMPAVVILALLGVQSLRNRRHARGEHGGAPPPT